jgi:hypothetical protein
VGWKGSDEGDDPRILHDVRRSAKQALQILDRCHVVAKLNKAVDDVRAKEAREMARKGYQPILSIPAGVFSNVERTGPPSTVRS